ncbi:Protein ShdD [Sporomusa carbonis]|uniref:non-oxidative hydroxyarylic acid decarboxylases subunit D n=1 Tax=Sporomusa carbonis TaxID=3076075 RepID=UPI003A7A9952
MKCARCLCDTADIVAHAPDGSNAWTVAYCRRCNFSWRSSEEEEVINPEKRDKAFQLADVDLGDLLIPVPIPPLVNK